MNIKSFLRVSLFTVMMVGILGVSSGLVCAQPIILFTADTDDTGGVSPIGAPADSNEGHLPGIDPGVTLSPASASLDGVETGPLGGIVYGPGAFGGNIGGTTGWVNSSFTFPSSGTFQLTWETSDVDDVGVDTGLAIDNVILNGGLLFGFEAGIPAGFTSLGTVGTSAAVTNLAPTQGDFFAYLDTTGGIPPIFDTVDGTFGSRLLSSLFAVSAGNVLSMDLAFLTNDGSEFHDYAVASVRVIPEPASLMLLGLGLLGLAGWRKRKT